MQILLILPRDNIYRDHSRLLSLMANLGLREALWSAGKEEARQINAIPPVPVEGI